MPGIKYIYVPFENVTLVQRKHDREIVPPGMVSLTNFISSKSDGVPTIRPDIKDYTSVNLEAFRTVLGDGSLDSTDEFLNSAFGLYGTENIIYITSRFPIDNSTDITIGTYSGVEYSTVISKIVDSGTATAAFDNDSKIVTISDSSQINMNQKSWRGACIVVDGDDTYWPIQTVVDKSTVVLECPSDFSNATAAFSVVQSHCPENDAYKFHTELFLSNSIYNTPIFDIPFSIHRMSGPFIGTISVTTDYIDYTATCTEFSEAQQEAFQDITQYGEYNWEMISRKYCASGNAIFLSTKPFWNKYEGDPLTLTHAGPYSTITPDVLSSYATPVEGGAGDIFSTLPINTTYTEFYNRSFSKAKIIFNGTNKFYMPVIAHQPDTGAGEDYSLVIMEFADDATPTVTAHFTDYSIGATEPDWCITNICYDSTNNDIILTTTDANSGEVSATGDLGVYDEVIVVSTADWSTSILTLPTPIVSFGLEYSETAGGFLVTGHNSSNEGVAMFYDGLWTTLTNPSGTVIYYGCGIYDDGTNWVFTITGNGKLFYWGVDDSSTVVYTGNEYGTDLNNGAFRTASNTFIYDPTGTPVYSTKVVLSGHDKIGIAEVNLTGDVSVSFIRIVEENFEEWNATYIGKFQRPIFYIDGFQQYVVSHTVGTGSTDFSHGVSLVNAEPGSNITYYVDEFTPISDLYRSKCFSIVNGYVVLFGLNEYDVNTDVWTYTPRRIRWTAPATVNDFVGTGAGTADVLGNGEFIDARTVNERIVIFESNAISALVPRGIVDDPFNYEVLHRGIKIASNPCVVNDICYFIADDGLLYQTNGVVVEEIGASFDLTEFDDFGYKRPSWLVYSVELNSLIVYYYDNSNYVMYSISLATGGVTSWTILKSGPYAKSVVTTESSSNVSTLFCLNPKTSGSSYDDVCCISKLDTGNGISGLTNFYREDASSEYFYSEIETGNLFGDISPEGIKVALKHIIVYTYSDASVVTYNPDIIIECKSLEDSSWTGVNDSSMEDSLTVTTSTAALSSSTPPSAFSYKLGTANGTAVTYNLPWPAANCRVYTYSSAYTPCTLVTTTPDAVNEYQITAANQIKVYGTSSHSVYAFCDNEPIIRTKVGDYVEYETSDSLLRITALPTYLTATLSDTDFNTATVSHRSAEQIPIGHGTVKIGINKLVEGLKLRIRVVPRAGGSNDTPTIVKITGISLGYVPIGEKILEATGS
jgi:hypothetical protein